MNIICCFHTALLKMLTHCVAQYINIMCCLINTVCCMQCRHYIPATIPASPLFQPTRSSNSVREFSDSEIQIFVLVQDSWPDRQSNAGRPGYWVGQLIESVVRTLERFFIVEQVLHRFYRLFLAYELCLHAPVAEQKMQVYSYFQNMFQAHE